MLVLVLLIFGVRGCLDARKERGLKDYVGEVATLVRDSDGQGKRLFDLLSGARGGDRAVPVENSLNQLRLDSRRLVDQARDTDAPDEVSEAQRYLVETLDFRSRGLAGIANALPTALADQERREGTERVAAQMQSFLASDVIYTQRVVASLSGTLKDEDVLAEVRIPNSQFLPDIDWLEPRFVAQRVSGVRSGRGNEPAAPGLHGNGIAAVTLGGQALTAGGAATLKLGNDLEFAVQVANQGENTETDVPVRVRVGRGGDAIELEKTLDTIAAGETKTVNVPLTEQPPTGQNVPIEVEVEAVPGEKKTDNNKQSYSAIFTR